MPSSLPLCPPCPAATASLMRALGRQGAQLPHLRCLATETAGARSLTSLPPPSRSRKKPQGRHLLSGMAFAEIVVVSTFGLAFSRCTTDPHRLWSKALAIDSAPSTLKAPLPQSEKSRNFISSRNSPTAFSWDA